ncbi:MAG: imidazole glycerol phosphate synthase subunit HisH [Steroidobacteraceae bacterium]
MNEVVIVDSGGANLGSLRYAFERLGARTHVSADGSVIASAERVVLPGVGAAGDAMARLTAAGLTQVIPALTQPVLGICLGMQLLFESSAEGATPGLGVFAGRIERIAEGSRQPVPHVGWNQFQILSPSPLLAGFTEREYAFFLHSYAAAVGPETCAACTYTEPFAAVVGRGNFHGTQFHPERSGPTGARLLSNFLALEP